MVTLCVEKRGRPESSRVINEAKDLKPLPNSLGDSCADTLRGLSGLSAREIRFKVSFIAELDEMGFASCYVIGNQHEEMASQVHNESEHGRVIDQGLYLAIGICV